MGRNTLGHVRCRARNKQGEPCKAWAIHGGTVCGQHGGRAPQVKAKAAERIQALVNPALDLLQNYLEETEGEHPVPSAVRLAAARDALDRAGWGATHRVEMSGEMTVVSPVDLELEEIAARLEKARESVEVEDANDRSGSIEGPR